MISTLFNKQDIATAFETLSSNRKMVLEVLLVQPKTGRVEGRGFFNDSDFLCEGVNSFLGRYNFALSPFAYLPDQIPSRNSYNQFDRALGETVAQDRGIAHSLTLGFFFKPDTVKEMENAPDLRQGILQTAYQVGAILDRMGLKTYSLEYNPQFLTARFIPAAMPADFKRPQLAKLAQVLQTRVEKDMFPAEHKKFVPRASLVQGYDPMPGLPGLFGDAKDTFTVWSLSPPHIAQEPIFTQLVEESLGIKKAAATADVYGPSNLQGLMQSWNADEEDAPKVSAPNTEARRQETHADSEGFADRKQKAEVEQLGKYLKTAAASLWSWPLYSGMFQRVYRGTQCGQVLLLQTDPFAGDPAFHFLLQSAETLAKEGKGQVLVFTKKRAAGELALAALSRHLRGNPLLAGNVPHDPEDLARSFASLFANPPLIPPCAPTEGLENLINYLDHDFQLRQKKTGSVPMPLCIVMDNLEEFRQADDHETYRALMKLRMRLRDLNATLWATHLVSPDKTEGARAYLGLADFHARFEYDGSGVGSDSAAWERSFSLDASLQSVLPDLSLARISFAAQGSHRHYPSQYLYHRPTSLFTETGGAQQG
jgi:hypothetical protein